jgi:hypothetical protein
MLEKEPVENQVQTSPVTPRLQVRMHPKPEGSGYGHGGARVGAGRRKGVPNKITNTFRDVLLQAVSEVGDSQEVGKDGQGGLLGYLKMCGVLERKTTLLLLGRILPLKINTEVKRVKETMSIEEAVADLKVCGLDGLLAFYLSRYPIGRDEENCSWASAIDVSLADKPIDVTPPEEDDAENDT